jgi:uncharacterized membrane protein YhaH (DUF805 family)
MTSVSSNLLWRVAALFCVSGKSLNENPRETIMHWYLEVVRKYALFTGRARRSEYWYFLLFNLIVAFVLTFADSAVRKIFGFGLFYPIYALAVLVPSIAVSIRRLHDTDRSGWWLLLAFVPLVGLVLIWFMAQEGNAGTNRYGQDPKLVIA